MQQRFLQMQNRTKISKNTDLANPQLVYIAKITPEDYYVKRGIHRHQKICEITLIQSGRGYYLIGENQELVQQGDVLIVDTGVLHGEGRVLPSICIGLIFDTKRPHYHLISSHIRPVFHFKSEISRALMAQANVAFNLLESPATQAQHLAANIICQSLLPFIMDHLFIDACLKKTSSVTAQLIKNYLDQHYSEKLQIQEVCQVLSLSQTYADSEFQNNYGLSPVQYLTGRRIGEAQTLLINYPKMLIYDVATAVGYENITYFNRVFKKFCGYSPSKYRNIYREQ